MSGGICVITVINETPREWDVRITQIGARFWYQDTEGNITRDWYGSKNTNLDTGQQDTFDSDDPSGCVQQNYVGVTVVIPGQPEKSFGGNNPGDKGHCQLGCTFRLAPKAFGGQLAGHNLQEALSKSPPLMLVLDEEYQRLMSAGQKSLN